MVSSTTARSGFFRPSVRPSGPGNGESVAFRFAVTSPDGDIFETFESAVPNWNVGDTVRLAGNPFRVTATIPVEKMSEFVDEPLLGERGRAGLDVVRVLLDRAAVRRTSPRRSSACCGGRRRRWR